MQRRTTRLLALTAGAALALSACGAGSDDAEGPAAGSDGVTTLTVGASSTPHAKILEYVDEELAPDAKLDLDITVFDDYDDIVDKTCDAWNFFEQDPMRIASITTRTWATVND